MLEELKKQGWNVEEGEDGTIFISACFDNGFWSHIDIWPIDAFKAHFANSKALSEEANQGDAAYFVTSIILHRMSESYNSHALEGKTTSLDEALQIAYEACQYEVERSDSFCDE